MKRFVLAEYERIKRSALGPRLCARLREFDEVFADANQGSTVFDWTRLDHVRAKNWVGVVQVPGCQIEILPKTDLNDESQVRANLLYMLQVGYRLPIQDRDIADIRVSKLPIVEALIRIFANRLLEELRRGLDRAYVRKEENARFVRGKVLLQEQARHNLLHKERVFVAYDEYHADTTLNRILKKACRVLLPQTSVVDTQRNLREALLNLADVADVEIKRPQFDSLHLTRNNERFRDLVEFCRIILLEGSPEPRTGRRRAFSLVFPMDSLFEEFVANFIRRNARRFGLQRRQVQVQAEGEARHLLRRDDGRGRLRLKPDVIIRDVDARPVLVLDTKWKRVADPDDKAAGVARSDFYQLYAYAQRYGCSDNVLLFPELKGSTARMYTTIGSQHVSRVRVEFLNLDRDLVNESRELAEELRRVLRPDG